MGGEHWKRSWRLLAPAGRLVAFGFSAAIEGSSRSWLHVIRQAITMPFITPLKAMGENKSLQGVNLGNLWSEERMMQRQLHRIIELYDKGVVRPHVDAEVPFDRAAEAHAMLEERKNKGKVVLVP
jgi:NADPH:quinone reductase-like Zn-dependent oxidoreductase